MALFSKKTKPVKRKTHHSASAAEANVTSAASTRWITAGVILLYVFGSVVSFFGLYGVAPWLKGPEITWWAVPAMVDLGIVIYKFAEIKLRQDPRKQHLAGQAKAGVLISTIVSSLANGFHVYQAQDADPVKLWGGLVVAALSPWFIYLAGSVLTDVVVKPKPKKPDVSRETLALRAQVEELTSAQKAQAKRRGKAEPEPVIPIVEEPVEELPVAPLEPSSPTFEKTGSVPLDRGW